MGFGGAQDGERHGSLFWLSVGSSLLVAGLVFYILYRPTTSFVMALAMPSVGVPSGELGRVVVGSLPTMLHTSAFGVLIGAVTGRVRTVAVTCVSVEWLFEVFQHPLIREVLLQQSFADFVPGWESFLRHGVFDWNDMFAAAIGGVLCSSIFRKN